MAPKLKRVVEDDDGGASGAPTVPEAPAALFGAPPSPEFSKLRQGFREVRVDAIRPNPNQARTVFDDDALTLLASSIERHGLQQPIIVRPEAGGGYVLIAGERRLRAHRRLDRETIPAFVSTGGADEIALIENIQRVDLDAVELARGLHGLVETHHYTQEQVGAVVGMPREDVTKVLGILRLPVSILQDYHSVAGRVSRSTLCELAQLTGTETEAAVLALWEQTKTGGRDVIRQVKKARREATPPDGHALLRVGRTLQSLEKSVAVLTGDAGLLEAAHRDRLLKLRDRINGLLGDVCANTNA